MNLVAKFRIVAVAVLAVAFAAASPRSAHAALLLDFTGGSADGGVPFNSTFGWSFTLGQSVTVTAIGIFDVGGDGVAGYDVAVWGDGFSPPIASAFVDDANSFTVASTSGLGVWRMRDVADFVLAPGTYALGAFYPDGGQTAIVDDAAAALAPAASFNGSRSFTGSPSLAFPGSVAGNDDGKFGPNLLLADPAAVPEPASAMALAAAAAALLTRRRASRFD